MFWQYIWGVDICPWSSLIRLKSAYSLLGAVLFASVCVIGDYHMVEVGYMHTIVFKWSGHYKSNSIQIYWDETGLDAIKLRWSIEGVTKWMKCLNKKM
jgi:hypothetical protein